jgi:hypothetical protein
MTAWRVIFTDSESMTGVAPVCEQQDDVSKHSSGDGFGTVVDPYGVYDCCPGPHIECWSETAAADLAARLSLAEAELCS